MNRIKSLRIEKGVSQNELAKHFNITQQAISGYESGSREPNAEMLKKLADYFDVSLDYLMGITDIRNPYEDVNFESNSKAKTLDDALIELMIKYGIVKDKNSVNEKHYQLIKFAIETYKDEQNSK